MICMQNKTTAHILDGAFGEWLDIIILVNSPSAFLTLPSEMIIHWKYLSEYHHLGQFVCEHISTVQVARTASTVFFWLRFNRGELNAAQHAETDPYRCKNISHERLENVPRKMCIKCQRAPKPKKLFIIFSLVEFLRIMSHLYMYLFLAFQFLIMSAIHDENRLFVITVYSRQQHHRCLSYPTGFWIRNLRSEPHATNSPVVPGSPLIRYLQLRLFLYCV